MAGEHKDLGGALRAASEARALNNPLSAPGSPPAELWLELAHEAHEFIELVTLLVSAQALPREAREELEQRLLSSLSHLQMHSQVLDESVTDALDLADQLEERGLLKTG
jgi:hypothetical protein